MTKLDLEFGLVYKENKDELHRILKNIIKDCFWDYKISENDIIRIVKNGNFNEKMFLFQKIIYNSTEVLRALMIFTEDDLKKLFKEIKIFGFNNDFIQKRKNLVEAIFFDKDVNIGELSWENANL